MVKAFFKKTICLYALRSIKEKYLFSDTENASAIVDCCSYLEEVISNG